jgi:hypothetical protein
VCSSFHSFIPVVFRGGFAVLREDGHRACFIASCVKRFIAFHETPPEPVHGQISPLHGRFHMRGRLHAGCTATRVGAARGRADPSTREAPCGFASAQWLS